MNNLSPPPVPELSSDWIAARREHLVREIMAPRRRPVSRRLAVSAVGALAAAGAATAAVLVGFAGAGASNAFAGWTPTPTRPVSSQTTAALQRCTSRLAGAGGSQSGIPTGGWRPVLTDTRGPFTAMILQSGSATATCVNGPSFTSTAANNAQSGGASQHTLSASSGPAARRPRWRSWGSAVPAPGRSAKPRSYSSPPAATSRTHSYRGKSRPT